jgi:hypothetical protein
MIDMSQLDLIAGFYFCHNCRRHVEHTRRVRRFRLCDDCWAAIMPDWEQEVVVKRGVVRPAAWYVKTKEQLQKSESYWGWVEKMEKQYPVPSRRSRTALYFSYLDHRNDAFDTDVYWPLCACGGQRQPLSFSRLPPGLFGGPFTSKCSVCEAKSRVESMAGMGLHLIHPKWDDEDWLDALQKTIPEAFELGILPGYWFELRGKPVTQPTLLGKDS